MSDRWGFTLIELMVVVVIIGILAAIAIPRFQYASWKAKEREADTILKQILVAQEAHKVKTGTFASTLAELESTGFYQPSDVVYYQLPSAGAYSLPLCLQSTGSWANRQIDTAGVLSDC